MSKSNIDKNVDPKIDPNINPQYGDAYECDGMEEEIKHADTDVEPQYYKRSSFNTIFG